jgi:demethylmenaquinone methyltransferase/2-methoxy-6-polyprenyl-1,4-benzoquinol methylase
MSSPDEGDPAAALIASQREYYDLRAPDFGDATRPDRIVPGFMDPATLRAVVDELAPRGDVLEIACGPGSVTRELVRHADSVTAIDASPRMLERNRTETGARSVRYVEADVFEWQPDRTFDVVFFANWLSHVPPSRFDRFWAVVRSCLGPEGRAGFIDEDDRAQSFDETGVVNGVPVARRTLDDGRWFDIVKVFWQPRDLTARLRTLGWSADVRRVAESFLYGSARPDATL